MRHKEIIKLGKKIYWKLEFHNTKKPIGKNDVIGDNILVSNNVILKKGVLCSSLVI